MYICTYANKTDNECFGDNVNDYNWFKKKQQENESDASHFFEKLA